MPWNLTPPAGEASPERELNVRIWGASGSLASWGTRVDGRACFLPSGPPSYLLSVLELPGPLQVAAVTPRPAHGSLPLLGRSFLSPDTSRTSHVSRAHCGALLRPARPVSASLPPTLPPGASQVVPISDDARRCRGSREEDWAGPRVEAGEVKWGLARGTIGSPGHQPASGSGARM